MKKHRLLIIGILCICIIITLIFIWYKRTHKFSYFFTSNEYTIEQSKSDKIIKFNLDLTNPEAEIDRKIEIDDKEAKEEAKKLAEKYQMKEEEFLSAFGGLDIVKYDMKMRKAMEILKK